MTSQKPTILHVIDTTGPGGAETVFLDIAEHMSVKGYEKLAIIKGTGWVQQQLEKRNIPFIVLKPYGFLSIPYYFQLLKLIKEHNVKYIQAHLLGSALTYSILSFFISAPVVATLHGQVDVNPNERFVSVKRWLLKKGLRKVVAVSGQLASYLDARGLFNKHQVEVIHNGINIERYKLTSTADLKVKLALPDNAKMVGSVGNIRPAKDYQNLIRAAKRVIEQKPATHFAIAGHSKQPLQAELDALVSEMGIQKNIHFLGFLDNTPAFLAQLDLFVLSSKAEGFSIATLEAMAARVPLVVTQCGGPEEIIEPNVDGLMVPANHPQALAESILRTLSNDFNGVEQAYNKVCEQFSLDTQLQKYRNLMQTELDLTEPNL